MDDEKMFNGNSYHVICIMGLVVAFFTCIISIFLTIMMLGITLNPDNGKSGMIIASAIVGFILLGSFAFSTNVKKRNPTQRYLPIFVLLLTPCCINFFLTSIIRTYFIE